MLKSLKIALALIFLSAFALNGQVIVKGNITDAITNESIIGATINTQTGKGTNSDINGAYSIKLEKGTYTITCNYIGYKTIKKKVNVDSEITTVNFELESKTGLEEIEITADIAKSRETPVAMSTISIARVQEEIAGRDISMIANTTPGVYASENGGGSGDSRVTIRGVDQRNIAVLVDGVPVNDMENGAVFWSNWDGLGEVLKYVQIQRGLGASKLAIPSLGGTMNFITRGVEQRESFGFKYEFGTRNQSRIAFGYSNQFFKNKFGITLAGSRKTGSAFPDGTYTDAWSYFVKLQYRPSTKHLFTFGFNGAPQEHGQRLSNLTITKYDTNYAKKIGFSADSIRAGVGIKPEFSNYGLAYNPAWGSLKNDEFVTNRNYYHKPLLSLNYTYSITSRVTLTSLFYASYGNGGGTSLVGSRSTLDASQRQYQFDTIFKYNTRPFVSNSNRGNIDKTFSDTEFKSTNYLTSNENNHRWYGGLISINAKLSDRFSFLGGVDLRYYRGLHFRKLYDMIGGNYVLDAGNSFNRNVFSNTALINFPKTVDKTTELQSAMRRKEDKIGFNYDGFVKWGGLFGQVEYKHNKITAYVTASGSISEYKRVDYFARKDVKINNEWKEQFIGYGDTVFVSGEKVVKFSSNLQKDNNPSTYRLKGDSIFITTAGKRDTLVGEVSKYTINSKEARYSTAATKSFPGYTLKTGVNYNLDEFNNVFANVGYLTIAPRFNNVYNNNNRVVNGADLQRITALDLGYSYRTKLFTANVNAYYTDWKNRPNNPIVNADGTSFNINGIDVLLRGIELESRLVVHKTLELSLIGSLGDWVYNSNTTSFGIDASGAVVDTIQVFAKGVHVSDAAQTVIGGSIRYMPIKGLYISPRYTNFSNQYANIDPSAISNEEIGGKDSWKIPGYSLLDLNCGYEFPKNGVTFTVFGNINNLLNSTFISDARNGANYDVYTSTVFVGAGRRYNIGIRLNF